MDRKIKNVFTGKKRTFFTKLKTFFTKRNFFLQYYKQNSRKTDPGGKKKQNWIDP